MSSSDKYRSLPENIEPCIHFENKTTIKYDNFTTEEFANKNCHPCAFIKYPSNFKACNICQLPISRQHSNNNCDICYNHIYKFLSDIFDDIPTIRESLFGYIDASLDNIPFKWGNANEKNKQYTTYKIEYINAKHNIARNIHKINKEKIIKSPEDILIDRTDQHTYISSVPTIDKKNVDYLSKVYGLGLTNITNIEEILLKILEKNNIYPCDYVQYKK